MPPREPIDAYMRELKRELRVPRQARRRVLREVRAHLLDAAEAERLNLPDGSSATEAERLNLPDGSSATEAERLNLPDGSSAAERAVARFGSAGETASQFNRLPRPGVALLRRALVPWVAAAALTSTATATVWAFQPGATRTHASRAWDVARGRHAVEIPRARPARNASPRAVAHRRRTP